MNKTNTGVGRRTVVIVLGMHRSGTSVLTRGLRALGVELGNGMLEPQPDNPQGFWENRAVFEANELMLSDLGSSWDGLGLIDWDRAPEVLKQDLRHRACRVIDQEFGDSPLIGFKDPRTPRLLPVWQGACSTLGLEDRYLIVVRNPISVARSLEVRNGFPHEKSHLLWLLHVVPSLLLTQGKQRCIVDYDRLMESPAATLKHISVALALATDGAPPAALEEFEKEFVSEALRHTIYDARAVASETSAPLYVSALYTELKKAASGEISLDYHGLRSALRRADEAITSFAPVLRLTETLDRGIKRGQAEIAALQTSSTSQNASHANLITELEQQRAELTTQLNETSRRNSTLSSAIELAQREIAMLRDERQYVLNERDRLLEELKQTLAQAQVQAQEARAERDRILTRIDSLSAQNQQLKHDADVTIGRLHSDVAMLRNSTSWRLTAPMRSVVTTARRIRRPFSGEGFRRMGALLRLARPHLTASVKEPGTMVRKVHVATNALRAGGLSAVAARLQLSQQMKDQAADIAAAFDGQRSGAAGVSIQTLMQGGFLPSSQSAPLPSDAPAVTVIVPVYKGAVETRECLESLLASRATVPFETLVIDDASPDDDVKRYLNSLAGAERVTVLHNPRNLGFVGTVNRGMSLAGKTDVVLLNSDTVVPVGWLDRMVAQVYSDPSIGTATPFSNNATICSYPDLYGWATLPDGETVDELDRAFQAANRGRRVDLPTAVGFCMYIKRECLADAGLFDEAAFGRGYGEENDFCIRSAGRGWKHILAGDVFVYHVGEKSFGASAQAQKNAAMEVIRARHPNYERDVAAHISANEAYPLRVAATAARYRNGQRPVILMVTHHLGGGTEKHVTELASSLAGQARILTLRPQMGSNGEDLLLESFDAQDKLSVGLSAIDLDLFARVLRSFGVARAHVHHTLGFSFSVESLLARLGIPYDLTLHDYHQICPRNNLFQPGRGYCGEPDPHGCNACILRAPEVGSRGEIVWWRARGQSLVAGAERVLCPSDDVNARVVRYFPGARTLTVPHEEIPVPEGRPEIPRPTHRTHRVVAILGALTPHKGIHLIEGVLDEIHRAHHAVEFVLIGSSEGALQERAGYSETGPYQDEELSNIIDRVSPDIILFAAQAQETYSYTLSSAIASGRPIVVTNVGALPERVENVPNALVVPSDVAAAELASRLATMPLQFFTKANEDRRREINHFYRTDYLAPLNANATAKAAHRPVIVVIPEMLGQIPSPCAYIRLLIPLSAADVQRAYDVRFLPLESALCIRADIYVTQRLALKSVDGIDRLRAHADRIGARIVYDIDDYLIRLPPEHPESAHYKEPAALVVKSLAVADESWVSTDALMRQLAPICRSIKLVANELDSRVVRSGPLRNVALQPTFRILYMGTTTHGPDLEIVLEALRMLHAQAGFAFELSLVGVVGTSPSDPWIQCIDIPATANSYPLFMNWLASLTPHDIGIAPLKDNLFNRCKSSIKYFDYTRLGLVTVASDLEPYRCIIDGETGFRTPNTASGWCDAFRRAHAARSQFDAILKRAQDSVVDIYGRARANGVRVRALEDVNSSSIGASSRSTPIVKTTDLSRELIAAAFLQGTGIEIGALHDPLKVPADVTVRYVDRLPAEGLAKHYPEIPSSSFVEIDIVDDGEKLSTLAAGTQDFVIANHFIEHAEDPIATIETFLRVLRPGGVVFLAVPDKRTTFDKDRKVTSLEHVIRDHVQGVDTSRRDHYEEWARFVEPNIGRTYDDPTNLARRADELMAQQYSIHFHCWEPTGFLAMLEHVRGEMAFPFEVSMFVERDDEFVVVLKKIDFATSSAQMFSEQTHALPAVGVPPEPVLR